MQFDIKKTVKEEKERRKAYLLSEIVGKSHVLVASFLLCKNCTFLPFS